MHIKVEIDISRALRVFELVIRKLPYALNNSLTRVAKEMVTAGQNEIAATLTVRKRFILNQLKILQYSRTSELTTVVGVDSSKVQGSPLILGFLEEDQGGEKESQFGDALAIPLTGGPARPSFQQSLVSSLQYSNLDIDQGKGKKKTFVIPGVGIFQRIRPGNDPGATIMVYSFKAKAEIKPRMHLIKVMTDVVNERFNAIFEEEYAKEIGQQRRTA